MKSRIAERIASQTFLIGWLRRPAYDVAEAVIRLRRLRGISQEQLADKVGTKQPAVARIESGLTNMRLQTIVKMAEALDATIRIDLEPCEFLRIESPYPRWWERATTVLMAASEQGPHEAISIDAAMFPSSAHVPSADYVAMLVGDRTAEMSWSPQPASRLDIVKAAIPSER